MTADKIFVNGQVVTVDESDRVAEAVAVEDCRILAVGTSAEMRRLAGPGTEVFDLAGRSLLPGFIDAHMHISLLGANKLGVSCKEPHVKSLDDILRGLEEMASETPEGEWVRAWGFNQARVEEGRYPTRWELDEVSGEHPIQVTRTCGHISIANSRALEKAGVDEQTPDPAGGRIERDADGVPTGVLLEAAHMGMTEAAAFGEDELRQALAAASEDLISSGITSIHDAGGYGAHNLRIMQQEVQSGNVKVRIYAMICALTDAEAMVEKALASGITTGLGDERYRIGPAKLFTDGSSSGPTIATRQPYTSDPGNHGILYYEQAYLDDVLGRAHRAGFQITAHAQGDRAVEMVIDCIEAALKSAPREDHRHRIEHCGITSPDLLERISNLGIIPIPNPAFFYEFGDGYVENYGEERVGSMYPARSFIDNGIQAAAGSDAPITEHDPLLGIHAAVNRKSSSGAAVGPGQRITIPEAIKLFTINGARASFEEDLKGSIEPGKLADLVVLDAPLLSTEKERIKDLRVDLTMVGGAVVYRRDGVDFGT